MLWAHNGLLIEYKMKLSLYLTGKVSIHVA